MQIEDNILRYYLRHCYFINGTAYAGKSTMVKMLAERYNMVCCGENYHNAISERVAMPDVQPDLCFMKNMKGWQEFVSRPPEEYARWIDGCSQEVAGFEVAQLLALGQTRRVIVDTNLSLPLLRRLAQPRHVALLIAPQSMSVERFFDRNDPEKAYILQQIEQSPDPVWTMHNYREGLAKINSPEVYDMYKNSGFFTLVRANDGRDTREETCQALADYFGLDDPFMDDDT